MAFRCGQNYTDGFKIRVKRKKYESSWKKKKTLESRKRERWPFVLSIDVFTSPRRGFDPK